MKKQCLPVSNHAVLRYLERVAAIDVEAVRQRIHDDTREAIANRASGIVVNGISYRFRGGVVTTITVKQHHARPLDWPDKPS